MIVPAVGRVLSPAEGTAFAIHPQKVLTAAHCVFETVDDPDTAVEEVRLKFPGEDERFAEVLEFDADQDWAVLRLAEPLPPNLRPLMAHPGLRIGEVCRCMGFPGAARDFGALSLLATFSGETERNGKPLLTLESPSIAAGLKASGLSGGPVLRTSPLEEVVGLIVRRLWDEQEEAQVGGLLFACPIALPREAPSLHLGPPGGQPPEVAIPGEEPPELKDLLQEVATGDPNAAGRLGQLLLARNRPEEAERWLRDAAQGGDPAATYTVGVMLDPDGSLYNEDPARAEEALAWFRRAATAGNVFGATTMGIRLHQRGQSEAAIPWLEEAVERGDAMAAHTLGRIREVQGRREAAEELERFAADLGDVRAAFDLGRMLVDRGERSQGIDWLQRATADPEAVQMLNQIEPDAPALADLETEA